MSDLQIGRIVFICIAATGCATAVFTSVLCENLLQRCEKLPRNRWLGMFFGWIALLLCVPHAAAVSPEFLLPYLLPMAIAVPILGFFWLDYPFARAWGGILILLGYYFVHSTFECHTPGAVLCAVAGWLIGILGIWISGKPCAMRDYLRLCTRSTLWRRIFAFFWYAAALLGIWALAMSKGA